MTAFVKATALRLFLSLCCKQADSSSQIGNVLFHLTSSKGREKGGEVEAQREKEEEKDASAPEK